MKLIVTVNGRRGFEDAIFREIISLQRNRIHHRMGSRKHERHRSERSPKQPLWDRFSNQRSLLLKSLSAHCGLLMTRDIQELVELYRKYDQTMHLKANEEIDELMHLCEASNRIFDRPDRRAVLDLLEDSDGRDLAMKEATRAVSTIAKIGSYYAASKLLIAAVKLHPEAFQSLNFNFVLPFRAVRSAISIEGPSTRCHVHAEIQLAVVCDQLGQELGRSSPWIIGTSKRACFLCEEFLRSHGKYLVEQGHGHLFSQWTIPDLESFNEEQVRTYRAVIQSISREVASLARQKHPRRVEHNTSFQDLAQRPPFSMPPSTVASNMSDVTIRQASKGSLHQEGAATRQLQSLKLGVVTPNHECLLATPDKTSNATTTNNAIQTGDDMFGAKSPDMTPRPVQNSTINSDHSDRHLLDTRSRNEADTTRILIPISTVGCTARVGQVELFFQSQATVDFEAIICQRPKQNQTPREIYLKDDIMIEDITVELSTDRSLCLQLGPRNGEQCVIHLTMKAHSND